VAYLAHQWVKVKLRFGDASSGGAVQPHPSHPLRQPEPPRCQRQTIPADGSVLTGRVHRTPDGAAVSLGHAVAKFRNPKRIPRRAAGQVNAKIVRRQQHRGTQ
jgi:hypothetical protein